MKTIALAAAKGGVGKSTLAAALATAAVLETPGLRVVLAELDPQGSLTRWWNTRAMPQPALVDAAGRPLAAVHRDMRADGFDLLFLDCPPGFSPILREAIFVADLVLVPTGASVLDLAAVASTADMAEDADVPFRFVLNRAVFRSRIAGAAVTALRARGNLMAPTVHQRVAIAAAMAAGRTVLETDPGCAAVFELSALWRSVSGCLTTAAVARSMRRRAGRGWA